MTRDQYIEIARKAGFEVDANGHLCLYGTGPVLMKSNDQETVVDGMKKMIDIAVEMKREEWCRKIELMPFGDTAASFAIWLRAQS